MCRLSDGAARADVLDDPSYQSSLPYNPPVPTLSSTQSSTSYQVDIVTTFDSVVSGLTAAALNMAMRCPDGWTSGGSPTRCWKVTDTMVSYFDANAACGPGATLATVSSSTDNSFGASMCGTRDVCFLGMCGALAQVHLAVVTWVGTTGYDDLITKEQWEWVGTFRVPA